MKHLEAYTKQKLVEKDIEDLVNFNEDLDDMKYKFQKMKRKWNNFWDWLFGNNSSEPEYNTFSDEYDDSIDDDGESKLSKFFKKNQDTLSDVIITWIKVVNSYDINRAKIHKMLQDSDEKTDKNFWRTNFALKHHKEKEKDCTFIFGKVKTKFKTETKENVAILITVAYKKILSIDVVKEFVDIIYWDDIVKYIKSDNFKKGLFDNNSAFDGYVHEDFYKKFKKLKMKFDDETSMYRFTIETGVSESIDVENLAWKVDKYFDKKTPQYNQFVKLIEKFREQHAITDEDIQEFLDKSKVDLKKFIDFICEDIDTAEQRDYMYLLRKTIQSIIDDKTITL